MTDDDIPCPRCLEGRLTVEVDEGDTLRECDHCGMVFDVSYLSDDYKCQLTT